MTFKKKKESDKVCETHQEKEVRNDEKNIVGDSEGKTHQSNY